MAKKKLGTWKVQRKSDRVLEVTLPEGMKITGNSINIEDLVDAANRYEVMKGGVPDEGEITVKCCHGNTAIA